MVCTIPCELYQSPPETDVLKISRIFFILLNLHVTLFEEKEEKFSIWRVIFTPQSTAMKSIKRKAFQLVAINVTQFLTEKFPITKKKKKFAEQRQFIYFYSTCN